MKILFDQNISLRIVNKIKDVFPECSQVRLVGLENASDLEIWTFAKQNGYGIMTFDADFYDLATLKGHPPKVIWLRIGNTTTSNLEKVLRTHSETILEFLTSDETTDISCLEIKSH
jgi:predicted nuclease of predicted toxin-antitoxin system